MKRWLTIATCVSDRSSARGLCGLWGGQYRRVQEIRSKAPSPQVQSAETPMGRIVPSESCSETNTDSHDRHLATTFDFDWDLLIDGQYGRDGYHGCSNLLWVLV